MVKLENKLYIGGGFIDSQLLWLFPIALGFACEGSINEIVFEALPKELTQTQLYSSAQELGIKITPESSIVGISDKPKQLKSRISRRLKAIWLAKKTNRSALLDNTISWNECQILHSVWDGAMVNTPDYQLEPSFLCLLSSASASIVALQKARLLSEYGIKTAFLGHSVYSARALKVGFQQDPSFLMFVHAANSLYRLPTERDLSFHIHTIDHWKLLLSLVKPSTIEAFKARRASGTSSYPDAQNAAKQSSLMQRPNVCENVVFLHVFRDSPFNYIDRGRIFSDYTEWFKHTLLILANSSEEWVIRVHPSSARWGEDPQERIRSVTRSVGFDKLPSNISIEYETPSSINAFASAKRVVTYSGSAALESMCFGLRPITISMTPGESYSPALVNRPLSRYHYRELLTSPASDPRFALDKTGIDIAWKLLYIVEDIISLRDRVGQLPVYRGDPPSVLSEDLASVSATLNHQVNSELKHLGRRLAQGLNGTYTW